MKAKTAKEAEVPAEMTTAEMDVVPPSETESVVPNADDGAGEGGEGDGGGSGGGWYLTMTDESNPDFRRWRRKLLLSWPCTVRQLNKTAEL